MAKKIPLIDIEPFYQNELGRQQVAREIAHACEEIGFVVIKNHGIDDAIIKNCWKAGRDFFDMPLKDRMLAFPQVAGHPYGYTPMKEEALAATLGIDTPPDLKEAYTVGPWDVPADLNDANALKFGYAGNIWPAKPPGFREALEKYYVALNGLGGQMMEIFAVALGLESNWFAGDTTHPVSALRILNYPCPNSAPEPNQYRAGPHTDYGCLTILLPEDSTGGLQVLSDGDWQDVPTIPDTYVINIGDMMARWTNDRWVSTMHQVVTPPDQGDETSRRQSMAFFYQPNWTTDVRCIPSCLEPGAEPKHPAVTAGEHLAAQYRKSTDI